MAAAAAYIKADGTGPIKKMGRKSVGHLTLITTRSAHPTDLEVYRVVQLDFTPEIEVFNMLFDKYQIKKRESSIKQHSEYFNFK